MSANIINFRPKKYGVDYHREEMERCGAEYIDALLSDDIEWVTTKGVLLTFYDEMTGKWRHEWSPTEQWILEQEQRKRDEEKRGVMSNISVERRGMANREIRAALPADYLGRAGPKCCSMCFVKPSAAWKPAMPRVCVTTSITCSPSK